MNTGLKFSTYFGRTGNSLKTAKRMMDILVKWRKPIEQGMYQSAMLLLEFAKELVPVDTGSLRDSAGVTMREGPQFNRFHAGFGSFGFDPGPRFSKEDNKVVTRKPARYAFWVHELYNSRHTPPHQFYYLREPALTKIAQLRQRFREGAGL